MASDTTNRGTSLLPCPFCGHDNPEFERLGTRSQSCIVACGNCGARHECGDEYLASGTSWNRRAQAPAPQGPSDAIVTKVAEFNVQPSVSVRLMERVQAMPVGTVVRLYAAAQPPAAMAPLTNERIAEIWVEHGLDDCDPEGFARRIEAAHGITGAPDGHQQT